MATDQEKNLIVLSDHIKHLATKQQTAVDKITGANRSIVDPARNIEDTHGVVASQANSPCPMPRMPVARQEPH